MFLLRSDFLTSVLIFASGVFFGLFLASVFN